MATVCKTAEAFEYDRPEIRLITPDMAKKLLRTCDSQPAVTKAVVSQYAKDIRQGLWRSPRHKVVLFPDGSLAAGHEYLRGIIQAGVPAKLLFERAKKPKRESAVQAKLSISEPIAKSEHVNGAASGIELITPELASKYLEANKANRRIRAHKVEMYARDMTAGRWQLNGQGISFSSSGMLLDGQHRLHAIVKSGVSVQMNVVRGLDRTAGATMDIGITRTDLDLASALGVSTDINNEFSAVAKAMRKSRRNGKETRQESVAFMISHLDAIRFAISIAKSNETKNAVVRSVIARAYYTVDHDALRRFINVFSTGVVAGPHESAVIPVLHLIARNRRDVLNTDNARASLSLKVQNALRAFLQQRPLTKAVECHGNLFLLPGEKD